MVDKIFSRKLVSWISGIIVGSEQNEASKPIGKLNPGDGDRQARSAFGLIGASLGGKTEWIDARKSRRYQFDAPTILGRRACWQRALAL